MAKNKDCFNYIDDKVTTDCSGEIKTIVPPWGYGLIGLCDGHIKEFEDKKKQAPDA